MYLDPTRREKGKRISSDMKSACNVKKSMMFWIMRRARVNGILVNQTLIYPLCVQDVLLS